MFSFKKKYMSVTKHIVWADRKAQTEELNPELSSSERTVLNNAPPDLSSSQQLF